MPVGYEVTNDQGQRAWWDGKKLTPLNDQGFQTKVPTQAAVNPQAFRRSQDSLKAIQDAKGRANWLTTGWIGGMTAPIPGSPAYNLDKDLDTLKARTAFEELAAMRAASPTGGALGNVTEKELALLQAAEANTDVGQGREQLTANLDRLGASITRRTPGLTLDAPADLTDGRSRATLPTGAYYLDPQRNVRRNDNGDRGNPIFKPAAPQPRPAPAPQAAAAPSRPPPPKRGDVVNGYRYNGGHPGNPKSWTKQ